MKITDLAEAAPLDGSETLPIVQGAATRRIRLSNLLIGAVDNAATDAAARVVPLARNMFDKARAAAGFYVSPASGALVAGAPYAASDFIRVIGGASYATLGALFANAAGGFAFYNGAGNFISGSTVPVAALGTFTVPAGAVFMRFTILTSQLASTMVVAGSAAPTAFADFAQIDTYGIRAALRDRLEDIFSHTPNLVIADALTPGYINTTSGAITTSAAYFTAYVPVENGRSYVANFSTAGGTGYLFLDPARQPIAGSGGSYTARSVLTAPVGAAWLAMSFAGTAADGVYGAGGATRYNLMIVEGTALPATYRAGGYADADQAMREGGKAAFGVLPAKPLLLDRTAMQSGTLLVAGGTTSADAGYNTTGLVPVRPGSLVYANQSFVPGNAGYGWNWYDRNRNRIGVSAGTVPVTTDGTTANITTTAYSGLAPGVPVRGTGIPANVWVVSGPAGGAPGTYLLSAPTTAAGTVTASYGGFIANVGISVPTGAHFGCTSWAALAPDHFELSSAPFGSGAGTGMSGYGVPLTADCAGMSGWADLQNLLPWCGRNLALLGDSIMQDANGVNAAHIGYTRWTRANGVIWGGVSGRKLRQVLSGAIPAAAGGRGNTGAYTAADFASVDLVYCNAVTNDWGLWDGTGSWVPERPLGALGDTGGSNTFHGDLYNTCIAKLQAWNPAMRIALSTPLPRFDHGATGNPVNSLGARLSDYADAVLAFGKAHAIPVLDLFSQSGINTANAALFMLPDGLHPNTAAYQKRLIPLIGKWLNRL